LKGYCAERMVEMKRGEGNNLAAVAIALMLSAFLAYASNLNEQKRSALIEPIVTPIIKLYMLSPAPAGSSASPDTTGANGWASRPSG
jgi:hypothetical protein